MGHSHHHNNYRHTTSNHNQSHSNRHTHQQQNHQQSGPKPSHMVHQYERPVGPTKPSRIERIKEKFQNRIKEKPPTREQIETLKVKAEHARYDADVTVHKARKAKAERENPSGWRRLFAPSQQPQRSGRSGRAGTRRPTAAQYYGGRGRGPPQMGDSMLIGPGSFSGDSMMFDSSGGSVGDNMLSFQDNGRGHENDMLSFKATSGSAITGSGKTGKGKKSEAMGLSFGKGAQDMFKF